MLLRFSDALIVTNKFDAEMSMLADRHYSRQSVGNRQFLPPGRTLCIRDAAGQMVFGWNWQYEHKRRDKQTGYCCCLFRNESRRKSSEIILECEQIALKRWGEHRMFTYVDPSKVASRNPGYCFKQAGWDLVKTTAGGLLLLEKIPT